MKFNGVKVFSATMVAERVLLGDRCTKWMDEQRAWGPFELVELCVTQSSDQAFHCITITVFYNAPVRW